MNKELKDFKAAIIQKIDHAMGLAASDIESIEGAKARGLESDLSNVIAELKGIHEGLISAKCAVVEVYCASIEQQYKDRTEKYKDDVIKSVIRNSVDGIMKEYYDSFSTNDEADNSEEAVVDEIVAHKGVNIVVIDKSSSKKHYEIVDHEGGNKTLLIRVSE